MKNKYGAKKVTAPDGEKFDSIKEFNRWGCLKMLERAGKISGLKRQVLYVLIPAQRDRTGKVVERELRYIADFEYYDMETGEKVVEDCKGYKTDVYRIKKKLMLWVHRIRVKET